MKMNRWWMLGVMAATSAIAQNNTNPTPAPPAPVATPAAVAPAPATAPTKASAQPPRHPKRQGRKAAERKAVKHPAAARKNSVAEPSVTLVPGPAVVGVSNLQVRGEAGYRGVVVTHLHYGDTVTILNQISLAHHKPGEPAQWARISLPAGAHTWVSALYIDATNKTVRARRLNLRAGPGENYGVLGVIERGAQVTEVATKGDWMEIAPPTNAYAFVAAKYLKQEAAPAAQTNIAVAETETAPPETNAPTPVPPPPSIAAAGTNAPAPETNAVPVAAETSAPSAAAAPNVPTPVAPPAPPQPPPPRIVSHEGVVRHVVSLAAPTDYELYDPVSYRNIDYLYTTSTNLNLARYDGLRIIVTGPEGLDVRWPDTPVITIQRIQVVH
ncbi:MAG: SH3 domain-containing protein [Verrucomicrobiota bacterium]|nr:SH3 domain-containing protein [Verrucomicrobiota bacterium]